MWVQDAGDRTFAQSVVSALALQMTGDFFSGMRLQRTSRIFRV